MDLWPCGTVSKTKSMVALKRERIERARTYKRIVEESQMLPSLVRLADYMITESLVSLAGSHSRPSTFFSPLAQLEHLRWIS